MQRSALFATAACAVLLGGASQSAQPPAAESTEPVVGQDLKKLRDAIRAGAVLWTVRNDHCTLQIVAVPTGARIVRTASPTSPFSPTSPTAMVLAEETQAWLVKADGTTITPLREWKSKAGGVPMSAGRGFERLFAFPRSAAQDAVAVAIRVNGEVHVEQLAPQKD